MTDSDIYHLTKKQEKIIWAVTIIFLFLYSLVIILSTINLTYMYSLKIRKTLIIALYFFCITGKITTACSVILFTMDPNGWNSALQLRVFGVAIFLILSEALTLMLTNFHLGTQIQYLRESISKD